MLSFPYRKNLQKLKLIRKQNYTEKCAGRFTSTTLLTLKRFYCHRTNYMVFVLKKLFYLLKEKPDNCITLRDATGYFKKKKHNALKTITTTDIFNKIFVLTVSLKNFVKL